jgi:hypothetical protein
VAIQTGENKSITFYRKIDGVIREDSHDRVAEIADAREVQQLGGYMPLQVEPARIVETWQNGVKSNKPMNFTCRLHGNAGTDREKQREAMF